MAAPDTNLERQKRWHRWPLIGIGVSVAFGILMMLLWLFGSVSDADPESPVEEQSGEQQSDGSAPAPGQETTY